MAVNPVAGGPCTVPQEEELCTASSGQSSDTSTDLYECSAQSSLEADMKFYSSAMSVDPRFGAFDKSAKQSQEGYDPLSGAYGQSQPQVDPLTGAFGTPRPAAPATRPHPAVDPLTGAFGTATPAQPATVVPAVIPALPSVPPTPPETPEVPQTHEPAISARQLRRLEEKISAFETKNSEEKVAEMSRSRVTRNLRDLNEFISELPDIPETQDIRRRATDVQNRLETKLIELFRAEMEAVPYNDSLCDLARTLGTTRVADRHHQTLLDLEEAVSRSSLDDPQKQLLLGDIGRRQAKIEQARLILEDMTACETPPPPVVTPVVTPPATNPPDWQLRTPPMWADPLMPPAQPTIVAAIPPAPPTPPEPYPEHLDVMPSLTGSQSAHVTNWGGSLTQIERRMSASDREWLIDKYEDIKEIIETLETYPRTQDVTDLLERARTISGQINAKIFELFGQEINAVPTVSALPAPASTVRELETQKRQVREHIATLTTLASAIDAGDSSLTDTQKRQLSQSIRERQTQLSAHLVTLDYNIFLVRIDAIPHGTDVPSVEENAFSSDVQRALAAVDSHLASLNSLESEMRAYTPVFDQGRLGTLNQRISQYRSDLATAQLSILEKIDMDSLNQDQAAGYYTTVSGRIEALGDSSSVRAVRQRYFDLRYELVQRIQAIIVAKIEAVQIPDDVTAATATTITARLDALDSEIQGLPISENDKVMLTGRLFDRRRALQQRIATNDRAGRIATGRQNIESLISDSHTLILDFARKVLKAHIAIAEAVSAQGSCTIERCSTSRDSFIELRSAAVRAVEDARNAFPRASAILADIERAIRELSAISPGDADDFTVPQMPTDMSQLSEDDRRTLTRERLLRPELPTAIAVPTTRIPPSLARYEQSREDDQGRVTFTFDADLRPSVSRRINDLDALADRLDSIGESLDISRYGVAFRMDAVFQVNFGEDGYVTSIMVVPLGSDIPSESHWTMYRAFVIEVAETVRVSSSYLSDPDAENPYAYRLRRSRSD